MLPLENGNLSNWESVQSPMFVSLFILQLAKGKAHFVSAAYVRRKICFFWAATEHCWSCSSFPHCSHFPHGSWAPAGSDIPGATSFFPETVAAPAALRLPSKAKEKMCHWKHSTSAPVPGVKHSLLSCSPPLSSPSYPGAGPKRVQFHGGRVPTWHSLGVSAWLESSTAGMRARELEVPWG